MSKIFEGWSLPPYSGRRGFSMTPPGADFDPPKKPGDPRPVLPGPLMFWVLVALAVLTFVALYFPHGDWSDLSGFSPW